jgi:t-SNARE complex subunit (syntaxin)
MDDTDQYIDEEVVVKTGKEIQVDTNEAIDEEVGMVDKLAEKAAETLGLIDKETSVNVKLLKAAAARNTAVKKAQAAQSIQKIVKLVIWFLIVVVIIGGVYVAYMVLTKGTTGVRLAIRKITGHTNGFK